MTRTPVKSSSIASIGHDGEHMTVEFTNGKVYHYANVPAHMHAALVSAPSVGQHFNQHIRGKFTHTPVDQEQS